MKMEFVLRMVAKILVVGSLNVDQIAYCPRLPLPGETILGEKYETGLGGKGANQAVQAGRRIQIAKQFIHFEL